MPSESERARAPGVPLEFPQQGAIGRQLAVGFGLVSGVTALMCALLLTLFGRLSNLVSEMQRDEVAIRESLALSLAVREQYIHQAHWIIERDDAHLHHYQDWLESIRESAQSLTRGNAGAGRESVRTLTEESAALDRLFWEELRPAVLAGDVEAVRRFHRRADELAQSLSRRADSLAEAIEAKMSRAHDRATEITRLALAAGGLGVLFVVALSAAFTRRLRSEVLRPLRVLSGAAQRIGQGDLSARVGTVGEGELGVVSLAFDHMAGEIQARERRLIESERMAAIGQLAAGVAHEVNNPIQIIRGYLKTMIPEAPSEELRGELCILDEEAESCQRIAEDLVAYSRPAHEHTQPIQMRPLLVEVGRRFSEAHREQASVRLEVDDGIVEGDAARLRQVVANLLLNASQISAPSCPTTLRGRADGRARYVVEVEDCGPGVAEEDTARIFEPFYSRRRGGSGLGLAVCQGIVRAHGGGIRVENRAEGGARFVVDLPLADGGAR